MKGSLTKDEWATIIDLIELEIYNSKCDIENMDINDPSLNDKQREWIQDHIDWQNKLAKLISKIESL